MKRTNHIGAANIVHTGTQQNKICHIEAELFFEKKHIVRAIECLINWRFDFPEFENIYPFYVRYIPADTEDIILSPFRDVDRYGVILFSYLPWNERERFNTFLIQTARRFHNEENIQFTHHIGKYAPIDREETEQWGYSPTAVKNGEKSDNASIRTTGFVIRLWWHECLNHNTHCDRKYRNKRKNRKIIQNQCTVNH